ncbi:hypothetical protein EMIT079MI2_300043 [Bacillus sp. IT-79MI2]
MYQDIIRALREQTCGGDRGGDCLMFAQTKSGSSLPSENSQ